MSSVLDQHDSYRQENRDFNEAPMLIEPKVALSDAGGNEDVKIANGHQESKSGARHLLDDDNKEQERSMEGNISKEENGNCSPPAGRPRSNSRSVSPSASRQKSPPAASRSPDASMSRSRSRSRSPVDCGRKPRSPGHSRSRTPSPSKRRGSYTPSHSRSRSRSADRRRPFSRSRSKTPDRRRRRGSPPPRRRGSSPVHRRRRSPSRSISRERDYRRRDRSRDRSRDRGRVERGSRLARPDVSQYRKPEKWLYNLFEDALKETLESTRLPCNVSKINDCMRRLDPTYRLDETEFPSFSVMCHWFDDMENLLEVSKQRDSIMLTGSRLESQVVKRLRSPVRGPPRGPRNRRRGRRVRSPPPRRRMRSRSPDRRDGGGRGGRRGGDSRSRSPDRRGGRGRGDDEDRWEME